MSRLGIEGAEALKGEVTVPGDKSISHRALIFNGVAQGSAKITGLLDAEDVASTARCMGALGATFDGERITGVGMRLSEPEDVLDCGNSGTSMRLLAGLLSGQPIFTVLTGDRHLRRRPMARVTTPLRSMGAHIDGRGGGERAPLAIRGAALELGAFSSAIASAQVKTAMILAALGGEGELDYTEPTLSRDHTERMLSAMGVVIERVGGSLRVRGGQVPQARDVVVPGDISSAAFFLVAAAVTPGSDLLLRNVGVNPSRSGVLDVLQAMGARLELLDPRDASGEPVADIRIRYSRLVGTSISGPLIPRLVDELPVLAVAASFASGETRITGASELRVKESDRIAATVAGLRAMSVDVDELEDGMHIQGGSPRAGEVWSAGDHRIAMAFLVAGAACAGRTIVNDTDNIATSFPSFPSCMAGLGAELSA